MSAAGDAFRQGDIAGAVAAATAAVKSSPADPGTRWLLAEMLLFAGEVERADRVLEAAALREPSPPVLEFRRLIRAELARRQCIREGRLPRFQGDAPTPAQEAALRGCVLLRAGDAAGAAEAAAEAETLRPRAPGSVDGRGFDDLRDADDLFAPCFEVLTTIGDYMWVPVERVRLLQFESAKRPRDLFWRRATIELRDATEGVVFLPCLYPWPGEAGDALRLGRTTEWTDPAEEPGPVRGRGQRLFLAGEEAVAIGEITELRLGGPDGAA